MLCGGALADRGLSDLWDNGTVVRAEPVFPNWRMVHLGSFDILLFDNDESPENITGVTVVNFGTAQDGDIQALYWIVTAEGGGPCMAGTGLHTMDYAGMYDVNDSGPLTLPAWTWSGNTLATDLSGCDDYGGGVILTIELYADIGPCPVEGRTIRLGFPVNKLNDPIYPGSISDYHADWVPTYTRIPWTNVTAAVSTPILYLYKLADREVAAPGDTVNYTIYYARPGTADISQIQILDTLPPYTHYLQGSGVPAPDPGWSPEPGPPKRLRWTLPGPLPPAGGMTGEVTFQLTIDWGNSESFEPGSGDFPAPEGERLLNEAAALFAGAACSRGTAPPHTLLVRRFLFWMLGDNDLLFSSSIGADPDEVVYSVYVKNLSSKKTWWDISIWDTVPPEIDVWCVGCGLYDPFLGWTMTPTTAAPGSPGRSVVAGNTILDWRVDLPSSATLELRWKAQVRDSVPGGSQAVNKMTMLAFGKTGIVEGTGSSVIPKSFTHIAPIALPTTYISYVAYGAEVDDGGPGFFIAFFPLNRKTQFQLFGIVYDGLQPFVMNGGVSDSINCLIGDCINGFMGNSGCTLGAGAIPGGGISGCRSERIPATYDPAWVSPEVPFNLVYKVVANSPLVWQLLTHVDDCNQDRHTYAPSTTINYRGWLHYTWPADFTEGSSLTFINTGMNSDLDYESDLATTVHVFKYDYPSFSWQYNRTYDIGPESMAAMLLQGPNSFPATSADFVPWRILSSDAALLVDVGSYIYSTSDCCCCQGGDNFAAFEPTRETGLTVTPTDGDGNPLPATLYGLTNDLGCGSYFSTCIVGNTGSVPAVFDLYFYTPFSAIGQPEIPALLRNSAGFWRKVGTYTVPNGLLDPDNPIIWNPGPFRAGGSLLHKIELRSGGPIQVITGTDVLSGWGGGAVIHSAQGKTMGGEFWLHQSSGWLPGGGKGCSRNTYAVDVFSPKTGTVISVESSDGYTAEYTTTGTDQCVKFINLTEPLEGQRRNYIFRAEGADVITVYNQCTQTEKGFTAPFLETGLHYGVVTPAVVYRGQQFWITVVVLGPGNITKTDYCGTSSFTSTDPEAVIEGVPMELYDFEWSSDEACSSPPNENGVKVFVQVTMDSLGMQTIVATDTQDGSIVGLGVVMVVAADVKLIKKPVFSTRASGETVEFKICWSNYSTATASNFVVTDRVPDGTTYVPEDLSGSLCDYTEMNPPSLLFGEAAYSTDTTATMPPAANFTTIAGSPPDTARWLRWTVVEAGIKSTGCVCFKVRVD